MRLISFALIALAAAELQVPRPPNHPRMYSKAKTSSAFNVSRIRRSVRMAML